MNRLRATGLLAVLLGAATMLGCLGGGDTSVGQGAAGLPAYGLISAEQAVEVILALQDDPDFVLLDIRTPAEVAAGHLPGASALDFYGDTFLQELSELDRDAVILIYCRTGNRTGQTLTRMTEMGFERVYDLANGITRWGALGYPVCVGRLGEEHTCVGHYPEAGAGA